MSTRRRIATLIAVIGVFVVGSTLADAWPRETSIIYDVGPEVGELDVDLVQHGEAMSSVRFRRPPESRQWFSHAPRLRPGNYQLHITMRERDGSAFEDVRTLRVPTDGPIRFNLHSGPPESSTSPLELGAENGLESGIVRRSDTTEHQKLD